MEATIEKRIKDSFARQTAMATIGASVTRVEKGAVTIELPFRSDLTQQHGFVHAGVVTMIVDTACGYAALTRMPASAAVLTAEYKVNFLSPAEGEKPVPEARAQTGPHLDGLLRRSACGQGGQGETGGDDAGHDDRARRNRSDGLANHPAAAIAAVFNAVTRHAVPSAWVHR